MNVQREDTTSAEMCGHFSVTGDRVYEQSDSSFRYFRKPQTPLNLFENLLQYGIKGKPNSYHDEKIENILKFIVKNKCQFIENSSTALTPSNKFITDRGVIVQIMLIPHVNQDELCIIATKYKGIIYLCQYTKPNMRIVAKERFNSGCPNNLYEFVFKNHCFSDDPSKSPNISKTVDACSQFFGVFKRKLLGRNFLLTADLHGVISNQKLNLGNPNSYKDLKFVELKVAATHNDQNHLSRFHGIKIWSQCFLAGVQDIFIGYRNINGVVQDIYKYRLDTLHRIYKLERETKASFESLENFLQYVENKLEKVDSPHTVFEFNWSRAGEVNYKIHEGETHFSMLPSWYLEEMNSN